MPAGDGSFVENYVLLQSRTAVGYMDGANSSLII